MDGYGAEHPDGTRRNLFHILNGKTGGPEGMRFLIDTGRNFFFGLRPVEKLSSMSWWFWGDTGLLLLLDREHE